MTNAAVFTNSKCEPFECDRLSSGVIRVRSAGAGAHVAVASVAQCDRGSMTLDGSTLDGEGFAAFKLWSQEK